MKKLFISLLMLFVVACTPSGESNFVSPKRLPYSNYDSADIQSVPFITEMGINHHIYMRNKVEELSMVWDMLDDGMSTKDIYRSIIGDDYADYFISETMVSNYAFDNDAKWLINGMRKNMSSRDLLSYMDKHNCRTDFNEVLISSYIVFTEEYPDDLPTHTIDWAGVGCLDAIGAIYSANPLGGAITSTGAIVGYLIREWTN